MTRCPVVLELAYFVQRRHVQRQARLVMVSCHVQRQARLVMDDESFREQKMRIRCVMRMWVLARVP